MLHKSISFGLKAQSESGNVGTFEGYAAYFGNIDRAGDVILPGAFKDTIAQFLSDGVILSQHRSSALIGRPIEAKETSEGLWLKAEILLSIEAGREAFELMKAGILKKMSIGYDVDDYEVLTSKNIEQYAPGASASEAARAVDYWGLALKSLTLYEVSPVSIPANPLADITGCKNIEGLRFDDHLLAALATVQGVKARAGQVAELRKSDGRTLGEKQRQALAQLRDAMAATTTDISALLDGKSHQAEGESRQAPGQSDAAPDPVATPDKTPDIDAKSQKERFEQRRKSLASQGVVLSGSVSR